MVTVIYTETLAVPNCFLAGSKYDFEIVGKIIKKSFLGFAKYKITVSTPYIDKPYYDGEYSTNRKLQVYEKILRNKLEFKLIELKQGNKL